MTTPTTPTGEQVRSLRETVQSRQGLGITEAQDYCANLVHVTRRAWQMWESGSRRMPPGLWELARIKLERSEGSLRQGGEG